MRSYGVRLANCDETKLNQAFIYDKTTGHLKVMADERLCLKSDENQVFSIGSCGTMDDASFGDDLIFGFSG